LAGMIARINRSQLAAVVGNLGAVIPAAVLLDWLVRTATGAPFLSRDLAEHGLQALHPLRSLTLPWAALTGVLLWVGSLAGGWLENWIVYRRIPEAVAGHPRVRRWLGPARAERVGEALGHHAAGVGS